MLGESDNVSTTTTTKSHKQDPNPAFKISTRGESFDSLLVESLNNESSTTTSPSQPKLKAHESIENIINKNNEAVNLLFEETTDSTNKSTKLPKDEVPSTRG